MGTARRFCLPESGSRKCRESETGSCDGDIFKICPRENIECYGIVVNNHVNNKNGDDFIVIFVFKSDVDIEQSVKKGIRKEDLLIDPEIVGKEYWTRGYFFNVGHIESKG